MNIAIVCGGTGGHLFPGIAVGEELLERHHQVLLLISEKEIDRKAIQGTAGFLVQTLPAVGWKGWKPGHIFQFVIGMAKSIIQTHRIFQNFHPDVIMGMGGFSSVAPLLLAWMRGLPSCIHESNVIAGRANRLAACLTSMITVGFETARQQFPKDKTVWTGIPVRSTLRVRGDAQQSRKKLGLSGRKSTVLIMGGSQGAHGLNRLVMEAASRISSVDVQWLHLTGVKDESEVRNGYVSMEKTARVNAFCHEMETWYAAADLVIARAGASSLAEIAARSLPSILIPYPFATNRHQSANARFFVETGAAVMWEESDCTSEKLASEIQDILTNKNHRKNMSDATQKLCCDHAHQKLADVVERLGRREQKD